MRIDETRGADERRDAIAAQLVVDDFDLAFDDPLDAVREVAGRDAVADDVILAVERALAKAGEVENGFAEGLAGDRAGVNAHTTGHLSPIDDGDALPELRGRDRS